MLAALSRAAARENQRFAALIVTYSFLSKGRKYMG
jgi:hypothetical protein